MARRGVDYSWARPGAARIRAAGFTFVARYLSHQAGKNISRAEAQELHRHDLAIVLVWESTARRPLDGRPAGRADAQTGLAQARTIGFPEDRPIYFAVDFDAQLRHQPAIDDYLRGAADVVGPRRVGVYGGFEVVRRCFDHRTARWGWQTLAWSQGRWEPRAHFRQVAIDQWNGTVDFNEAVVDDFGQWEAGIGVPATTFRRILREETTNVLNGQARRVAGITSWEAYLEAVLQAARKT